MLITIFLSCLTVISTANGNPGHSIKTEREFETTYDSGTDSYTSTMPPSVTVPSESNPSYHETDIDTGSQSTGTDMVDITHEPAVETTSGANTVRTKNSVDLTEFQLLVKKSRVLFVMERVQ
ncbi:hypothetical protein RF11_00308 [Thelohanellus kitauei]|uniref:Uncharacterized protein n=1 Tax=Thelohanellus kitauei TaxID=669202 RepID=A0A0C2N0N2_THEKT|nr:hypothetical protein RF11_00308 [Thelohanellus kitauei]